MIAGSPVRVEGLTRNGSAGLHCRLEIVGASAASAMCRLRLAGGSLRVDGDPEVRTFPATAVLPELMRCVPGEPDRVAREADDVRIPWETAAAVARDPNGLGATYARSVMGWGEVPEAFASVLGAIRNEVAVVVAGPGGVSLRRWISGDGGWIGLGFEQGELLLTPCTRIDMARALTTDLAGAVASAVARPCDG